MTQKAIIIGAGPAGLTAAYEMLTRTGIKPVLLEMSDMVGGISRTINFKGNRIDIGGHRFFSKVDRVMDWWLKMLPMEATTHGDFAIKYQGKSANITGNDAGPDPNLTDDVMLVRNRKSRIYYLRKFFDYPITLNKSTVMNLGLARMAKIGMSYTKASMMPIRNEQNLEQFLINRFGRELYLTFFKSYTEKVWGVPCNEISASWGAQRIKGLSITKAVMHALKKPFQKKNADINQKGTETSLIERFLYPKHGPGQMWETCTKKVIEMGGELHQHLLVKQLITADNKVTGLIAENQKTGETVKFEGDYFFSTMPVRDLLRGINSVPNDVKYVSEGLMYRDFITVGVLLNKLKLKEKNGGLLTDNWIYIQEPDVHIGRLQIFNNWSPYMVQDPDTVWLGLEYFCNDTDEMWRYSDSDMAALGVDELIKIGMISRDDVLDSTVIRVPKTYPAYFGTYDRFDEIRNFVDRFENLFLVGRNGMHRYNNQDHSMLTAMVSVDNIAAGRKDKANIWDVNTEQDYHEDKSGK